MASVMGICGGLVGPESGNVKNRWVSPLLFEGSRGPRGRQDRQQSAGKCRPKSKKRRCFIKSASCRSSELCFLLRRGAHFHKNHESMSPKNEKCCQNHVGYIKISQRWGRMHLDVIKIVSDASLKSAKEATCSNNTHICKVF